LKIRHRADAIEVLAIALVATSFGFVVWIDLTVMAAAAMPR